MRREEQGTYFGGRGGAGVQGVGGGDSHCLALPEEEDPGDQGVQHDGEEQRGHVENGKIDEVNGQVELPLDSVSALHVPVLAHLSVTAQPLPTAFDVRVRGVMRCTHKSNLC